MVEITGIKLDKADRIILAELDRNCRVPASRLAKLSRKSRQSVEYRIKNLQRQGVITSFNAAINPHRMGLRLYKLYFRLRNIPDEKKRLLDYLRNSGNVYWMGVCNGNWDAIFSIFAKDDYEFYRLKNEILSNFGDIILENYGDALLDVKQYPKMYFTGERREPTMFAGGVVQNKLGKLDFGILAKVVNNARAPISEIASQAGASPATVASRLARMEKLGIIIQYRIGIDLSRLGLEYYKAIIRLERYSREDEKRLLEYVSSLPNTQYFIRNIWNIEPEFVVSNYQEYLAIIERLKMLFPKAIRAIETVYMKTDEWTPGFRNLFAPQK